MIGYVTLGTRDFERALGFYDALFESLGAKRYWGNERMQLWTVSPMQAGFGVVKPYDGGEASVGNGTMVALAVDASDKVDRLHARALELGGSNEGAPGDRGQGFYAGYFRDLDGNKLNVFCIRR